MIKTALLAFVFVLPLYALWAFTSLLDSDVPLWLNSLLGLLSLVVFFAISPERRWGFGFWVGLLWFHWVGFSLIYFGFGFLVPFVSLFVAAIYMLLFALALWFANPIYRLSSLLLLGHIHPFGFDWMQIGSFFAYSYFGVGYEEFFLLALGAMGLNLARSKRAKTLATPSLFCLILALDLSTLTPSRSPLPFKANLIHTNFPQDSKWQKENLHQNTKYQLSLLFSSIQQGYELSVLPETAFPFALQESPYFEILKNLSRHSTIVVGSLRREGGHLYNSSFIFQEGRVQVFDKVILAPFGEKIPLPDFLARPLQRIFLGDEAPEFSSSPNFGSFELKGFTIKSLICYEGTSPEAYTRTTPYTLIISNNAWFPHSIEASLQKGLMKYYARAHGTTILHASNGSPSFVITP